ncbi:hypothetical protein EW146_g4840 [Bondarzewia mesenterica]|uniref:Uncharacterized protein n=1 Tax=Bondarzewia mesenterica TaxID=1095465 RepID=A0A4S4LZ15_9AGAM|nr:hypothetical protein EW146_g4840 [Bondarzewia mesenterica]
MGITTRGKVSASRMISSAIVYSTSTSLLMPPSELNQLGHSEYTGDHQRVVSDIGASFGKNPTTHSCCDYCHHLTAMANINVLSVYLDNNDKKEVFLQASGKNYSGTGQRHVLLCWKNLHDHRNLVMQIIQWIGIPGAYQWQNVARFRNMYTFISGNDIYPLGFFTRGQRDRIIELAGMVEFDRTSTVNTCRVWMRDLLEAMTNDAVVSLSQIKFNEINKGVPLLKRQTEVA